MEKVFPKISVITSSLNRVEYLEESIIGVLRQGYPNLEYMIVDGASTDGTVDIIRKYEKSIYWWISEKDQGEASAVNKALLKATGDIITFASSDDVYENDAFKTVARLSQEMDSAGAFAGAFIYMDENSQHYSDIYSARFPFDEPVDLSTIRGGSWRIHQQACFFRAKALDKVGRYLREDLKYNHDRELLYRICSQYRVAISSKVFAAVRVHNASLTKGNSISRTQADREAIVLQESYYCGDANDNKRRAVGRNLWAKYYRNKAKRSTSLVAGVFNLICSIYADPASLMTKVHVEAWKMFLLNRTSHWRNRLAIQKKKLGRNA
jgi:glycosyltransferase involved in cell wall biosynthesis